MDLEPPNPPRPRDAATLVLVRQDGGAPQILMGRRSGGHDFMPGKWVFPGGRIERADYAARATAELPHETAAWLSATARLKRQDGARLGRALAAAAVRETFEETGLVLGRLDGRRLVCDLSGLKPLARAITPPARHKRFDARFLMADAAGLQSLSPSDSRELDDVRWVPLVDCRALDLPLVTRAVFDVLEARLRGDPAPSPFWRWVRGRPDAER